MAIEVGAAMYGGPRPLTGPSFRVDVLVVGKVFRVISTPHPIHYGTVSRSLVTGRWVCWVETASVKGKSFGPTELTPALRHTGAIIGALYRVDMRSKFSAAQRYILGRNLCPAKVPCPDGVGCLRRDTPATTHYHLCKGAPDNPHTIFCSDHCARPDMPGDAFRSIDDSTGGE